MVLKDKREKDKEEEMGDETEAERASCFHTNDDENGAISDASRKKLRLSKE